MTIYLDFCATTPVHKKVADTVYEYMVDEYGNSGSRTHEFGIRAKKAVEASRKTIALALDSEPAEVIFTSGATESNNIAILGLIAAAKSANKKHIISSLTEHKAVIEPIKHLESIGFEVTWLKPNPDGAIDPQDVNKNLREDTFLISIMHVNNETGVINDIDGIAESLVEHDAYFHVDAAQSFGKLTQPLTNKRIDLISLSGHKVFAPMGIGALIARRRGYKKLPLQPLMFGGGQERGLRAGTLPVPLIVGFGEAIKLATKHEQANWNKCRELKSALLVKLEKLGAVIHGKNTMPNIVNFSIPKVNSEALMVALKGIAAISNGSACTSSNYSLSHVLLAMDVSEKEIMEAVRISWSSNKSLSEFSHLIEVIQEFI